MDFSGERSDKSFCCDQMSIQDNSAHSLFKISEDEDYLFPIHISEDEPPTLFTRKSPSMDLYPIGSILDPFLISPLTLSIKSKSSSKDSDELMKGTLPFYYTKDPSLDSLRLSIPSNEHPSNEMEIETSELPPLPPISAIDFTVSLDPSLPAYIPPQLSTIDMILPSEEESISSHLDDSDNDYDDCKEHFKRRKTNHTWEETASQLQLQVSTQEMQNYSIPEHWLTATDYLQLLTDAEKGKLAFPYFDLGHDKHGITFHPEFIYQNPCPAIYFLRCDHLKNGKTMFGFPRIKNVSKEYTWKKQGFTTVIPKSSPTIRYITANCYLCGKGRNKNNIFAAFSGREPVLRMHAVMKIKVFQTRGNTEKYQNDNYIDEGPFVLIHILKGGSHSSN